MLPKKWLIIFGVTRDGVYGRLGIVNFLMIIFQLMLVSACRFVLMWRKLKNVICCIILIETIIIYGKI